MMRQAKHIHDYNFREYALRRVKAGFRQHQSANGPELQTALQFGQEQLQVMQRFAQMSQSYPSARSVMESAPFMG
ncbi:hypothetical protein FisN_1Hu034 [Fistulifera solaris]|uniref:Complex 1 LYR protein domain-containing protein n=1 Tax=Fistulifera solaris TaxID=1519565 RepID=A0A1Z5KSR2_FISSO|nr:hypothetical protein FisN_1Hu034 [Fistulifera solaris]|eukprot:GAX28968.1 hypothetical protein FisN_1Hu034 [Fistulifera solaris]